MFGSIRPARCEASSIVLRITVVSSWRLDTKPMKIALTALMLASVFVSNNKGQSTRAQHMLDLTRAKVYAVTIKNTANARVNIPWSVNREAFEREGNGFTQASLALVISDPDGRQHRFGAVTLYGTPKIPGSIETLAVGEVAEIKAHGKANCETNAATRIASSGAVVVRAVFTMGSSVSAPNWEPLLSENGLSVLFRLAAAR
jgi:hypothetical protein